MVNWEPQVDSVFDLWPVFHIDVLILHDNSAAIRVACIDIRTEMKRKITMRKFDSVLQLPLKSIECYVVCIVPDYGNQAYFGKRCFSLLPHFPVGCF